MVGSDDTLYKVVHGVVCLDNAKGVNINLDLNGAQMY